MRILVTGHHGYIGSVLTPVLSDAGHEVVGLDAFWFGENCSLTHSENGQYLDRDVRDVTASDLQGFDAIVHLAGLSNDPLGDLKPKWTYEINHWASVRLAQLARAAGVKRFVFSSSCSVYGASGDAYLNEESPVQPVTPYAESKARVEEDVSKLADSEFSPVFLRNATAYGVSPRLRLDLVLNNLVASACATGSVLIMSDGSPWRPLVHIQDISRAVLAALEAPAQNIRGQIFNVGRNSENYQVSELANLVCQVVPGCSVRYAENGGPDPRCYRVDFTKFEQTFPHSPLRWDAWRGTQELYEAYRNYGLTATDLTSPRFIRLKQVEQLLSSGQLKGDLRWDDSKRSHQIGSLRTTKIQLEDGYSSVEPTVGKTWVRGSNEQSSDKVA